MYTSPALNYLFLDNYPHFNIPNIQKQHQTQNLSKLKLHKRIFKYPTFFCIIMSFGVFIHT